MEEAAGQLALMVSDLQGARRSVREVGFKATLAYDDADLLEIARGDHVLWVQRMHEMMLGREQVRPDEVTDHSLCRLGKWYTGPGREVCGHLPAFRKLEEPHRQLHHLARKAAEAWKAGRKADAHDAVKGVVACSQQVLALMGELTASVGRSK